MRLILTLILALSSYSFGLRADINQDGIVDFLDLSILSEEWLMSSNYLTFDAGLVTVPDNDALDFGTGDFIGTGDFSICFWADVFSDTDAIYVSKGLSDVYWKIYRIGSDVAISFNDGEDDADGATKQIPSDGWHHVAFSIDRDGNSYCYIDGVAGTVRVISDSRGSLNNSSNLIIGANYAGSMDDLRIYKKALTPAEVLTIYNNGTSKVYTVLDTPTSGAASAAWNMNEGAGTTITDEINGLVGTFSATGVSWLARGGENLNSLWELAFGQSICNDADVASMIGDRLYNGYAPPTAIKPYVIYQQISGPRDHTFDGPSGLATINIQLSIFDSTYLGARTTADYIRRYLDGYEGTVSLTGGGTCKILESKLTDEGDIPSERPDNVVVYGKRQDYEIVIDERP